MPENIPSNQADQNASLNRQRILLADDHHLVRDALVSVINCSDEFEVYTASSLETVRDQVTQHGPFVVTLLDINMPGMEGLKSVSEVVNIDEAGAVVMMSGNISQDFIAQGMSAGASGFLSKTMKLGGLVPAIRLIASGEKFVVASAMSNIKEGWSGQTDTKAAGGDLSRQELEVLQLVATGLQNKEISWKTGHSEVKVKMYMRNICKKLDVTNRTGAALKARALGFI